MDNTPFNIVETKRLECQFGPHYYKEKTSRSHRVKLQGSRKFGCNAHIIIKKCATYPEYQVIPKEKAALRTIKETMMKKLKQQMAEDPERVETVTMYYVSLPMEEAHHGHPTGKRVAGFAQRMNDKVAAELVQIVAEGVTEIKQVRSLSTCTHTLTHKTISQHFFIPCNNTHKVRSLLRHYVMNDLCKDNVPNPNDRAYFPLDTDLRNHIFMAKQALQLSCLDQENAHLKIEKWKDSDPENQHFFRPFLEEIVKSNPMIDKAPITSVDEANGKFRGNDGVDDTSAIVDNNRYKQTLLWVHQTEWQKNLIVRYGNTISLIDATYKTTKYELALFFICVRTNVGYSVVAEFIIQSETTENIREAMEMLRDWNPEWNPQYFMSDYSEAELSVIEAVFPNTKTYLCDFHR